MALVYHYCSPQAFLQIIEKKCIWLSSTNNMNDSTEGRWFISIVKRVLDEHKNELGEEWCKTVIGGLDNNYKPNYIACFSKNGDSLSQWRSYAQDGAGVSIGLDDQKIELLRKSTIPEENGGAPNLHITLEFQDVDYQGYEHYQEKIIERARYWIEEVRNPLSAFYMQNEGFYNDSSAAFFCYECEQASAIAKNPAFIEEQERRLIFKPNYSQMELKEFPGLAGKRKKQAMQELGGVKHRISDGFLTSHFELGFNKESIKKVILGPKNKFSFTDVNSFLVLNDMEYVEIERSSATYR